MFKCLSKTFLAFFILNRDITLDAATFFFSFWLTIYFKGILFLFLNVKIEEMSYDSEILSKRVAKSINLKAFT